MWLRRRSLLVGVGAVAVTVIAGLYLWPLAHSGIWIAGDSPFYLAIAYAVEENLRTGRGLWGWAAHDLGGFPVFSLFIPSALGILGTVAAHWAGLASLPLAYKGLLVVAVLLPGLSLWFTLTRTLGPAVAFLTANLYLLQSYSVVDPLSGRWGAYLAAGFLFLLLWVGAEWHRQGPTWGRALSTLALATAIAMSEAPAWIGLVCGVAALSIVHSGRGSTVARIVGWAGLSLSPLMVWLFQLTTGGSGEWGVIPEGNFLPKSMLLWLPTRFLFPGSGELILEELVPAIGNRAWGAGTLVMGRLFLKHLPEFGLFALVLAGVHKLFWRSSELGRPLRRWGLMHLLTAVLLLVTVFLPRGLVGEWLMQPERLAPYITMAWVGVAATALQSVRLRFCRAWPRSTAMLLTLALVLAHAGRYVTYGDHLLLKTADESVVYQELSDIWGYLRARGLQGSTRVLYETLEGLGFLDGGTSHATALSAQATGLPSLASWKLTTLAWIRFPPVKAEGYPFQHLSGLPGIMRRWNCAYLVVWWPGTREKLRASGAFEIVHESPNRLFAVLRLRDYEPSWLEFQRPVQRLPQGEVVAGGVLRFRVENPWAGNHAILKITYHPWWHAWVNGAAVRVAALDRQIAIEDLPTGFVELRFVFCTPWQKVCADAS